MTASSATTGTETYVVATAGHVDHGKSTLLRALTGTDPDRLAEERRRGLTLDLGFVWTSTPGGRRLAFVDVPGHHRYLATTFAGLATSPAVLLVVSADEGWRPQTGEHLAALDAFGVEDGLLVITRTDLADPAAALAQAREHTAGTSLADVPAVAVSARTGTGLAELVHRLDGLAGMASARLTADPHAPVRLWLDRVFTVDGAGTVVTGTLTTGTLAVEDTLELAPAGTTVAVRGLQCLGEHVPLVTGPARVAVNLRRVSAAGIRRGNALVTPGSWWRTSSVDIRFAAPTVPAGRPPGPTPRLPAEPLVHCGTEATSARLRALGPDTARLALRTPLDLHVGDRLLVRDPGSRLLRGATVLDVDPPALRRRGAAAARARHLTVVDDPTDPATRLRSTGFATHAELTAMGFAPDRTEALDTCAAGPYLLDPWYADRTAAALREQVDRHSAAQPDDPGLPVPRARQLLGLPDALPVTALSGRELEVRDGRIYRTTDAQRLPAPVAAALDRLLAHLRDAPFLAPTRQQLDVLGLTTDSLALLVRRGHLERIGPSYLPAGATLRAVDQLRTLPGSFGPGECARALGTSRRVAVPLLEALDDAGLTRRDADGRRTLTPPTAS